jgi:hypothetical protein
MTTRLMTTQELNKLLTELMRQPRTAETATAIDKVRAQIKLAKAAGR